MTTLNRREFIKLAGILSAQAGLIGCSAPGSEGNVVNAANWPTSLASAGAQISPAVHLLNRLTLPVKGLAMKTILIIDDNDLIRNLLSAIFEISLPNAHIVEAVDGAEGLQKAFVHCPELIFVDGQMPKLPGNEVVKRLRTNPATQSSRIIGLTGEDRNSQVVREMQTFCDALLFKPFKSVEITRACFATGNENAIARRNDEAISTYCSAETTSLSLAVT